MIPVRLHDDEFLACTRDVFKRLAQPWKHRTVLARPAVERVERLASGRTWGPHQGCRQRASQDGRAALRPIRERELTASFIKDTGAPVVEIGTGSCACLTLLLAAHRLRILAIDRDAGAVADARQVLATIGVLGRAAVVQAEAARLPLRPGSVRTVVTYDALHHATHLRAAVAGIASVLHRRGRLIVSDRDEAGNGFLGRLSRALRAAFRKVIVLPRRGRRLYICEHPRRAARRAEPWRHRNRSPVRGERGWIARSR